MIYYKENKLTVDIYLSLRKLVNWKSLSYSQAQKALDNSLYTICAYEDDIPVGMGRIIGDGAVICYVQDLVIHPSKQGSGLGSDILLVLIDYVKSIGIKDTTMMLDLMCAKGREEFYKKHGFISRPNDLLGPGMIQYIKL